MTTSDPLTTRLAARAAAAHALARAVADAERDVADATTSSREALLDARRRLEVVRRQQQALLDRTDERRRLAREALDGSRPTALVGHRMAWSADRVRRCLEEAGVEVLACVDNGADLVGVAAAEQPDLVVLHDRLVMVRGQDVVPLLRELAPGARVVTQAESDAEADALVEAGATAALGRAATADELASAGAALLRVEVSPPRAALEGHQAST